MIFQSFLTPPRPQCDAFYAVFARHRAGVAREFEIRRSSPRVHDVSGDGSGADLVDGDKGHGAVGQELAVELDVPAHGGARGAGEKMIRAHPAEHQFKPHSENRVALGQAALPLN